MTYELTGQIEELLGQPARGQSVNAMFLCPFHDESTPSFSVHLEEGLWYCFGCGRKGNLEQLYKQLGEELSEDQRLSRLIKSVYREPEAPRNFAALANHHRRSFKGREGQSLWQSFVRRFSVRPDADSHFSVGYSAEKKALAFPYWLDDGTVPAIKYRRADGSKFSEDGSRRVLYNINDAIGSPVVLICEGESDTITAWSRVQGNVAVCGSPGAGVSEKTWANWGVDLLFARRIYVAFDNDEAGSNGATTAMRVLGSERCVRVVPTRGVDISEHIMKGGTLGELGVAEADDDIGISEKAS